jgi:DNA-binding transcriptional regulator YiaG
MTNKQFYQVWSNALANNSRDEFVSSWALSSVSLVNELGTVWDVAHMSIRDMCAESGMTAPEMAELFCIPPRTMQHWCAGTRVPADYIRLMMAEYLGFIKR